MVIDAAIKFSVEFLDTISESLAEEVLGEGVVSTVSFVLSAEVTRMMVNTNLVEPVS